MEKQNYKNHVRYYTPHHFVFYPMGTLMACFCGYEGYTHPGQRLVWLMFGAIIAMVLWLSFMLRQHYALNNQNRIVLLEVRYRYFVLTQQRFEPLEAQLSHGQVFALRFACDEELPALAQLAVKENLSPDEIKRSIKNWKPDLMRA